MLQEKSSLQNNTESSAHWLTEILHQASLHGLDTAPSGVWSSPGEHTEKILLRFSQMLSSHEHAPPAVLSWLSGFEHNSILERVADHPNTPDEILHKLALSKKPEIRSAVADNPSTPFELLFNLSLDEHPDVRFRLAENANNPTEILQILAEDENPFVASRAQQSLRSLTKAAKCTNRAQKQISKVLIVDDDDVTRLVLSLALKTDPQVQVIAQAKDGESALQLTQELHPDIILMDIGMPGMNGIETMAKIKALGKECKIIMVTGHDSLDDIMRAFGNGAEGYHLKSAPNNDLSRAIRVVASGESWLDPGIASLVLRELSHMSISRLHEMTIVDNQALPNPAESLLKLSEEYLERECYSEARQICQAAYSLAQSLYGSEAASTKESLSRLAELYFHESDYGKCESIYLDLLNMQSKLCQLDTPELESSLRLLAEFYEFRWNFAQAELFYTWLLRVQESTGKTAEAADTRRRLESIAFKSAGKVEALSS